ncbi:MAG: glucose-6-phosphate isomerase [Alphaproteobacteria bacterium]|nr:glucose-6-phosphate isomerase [Alphaproteobacteria bacterium]
MTSQMSNKSPQSFTTWKDLEKHQKDISGMHMRDMFSIDTKRFERMHQTCDNLIFDYAKHRINQDTIEKLCALAEEANFPQKRADMLAGETINTTEKRAVLHTALRGSTDTALCVNGENVTAFVLQLHAKIKVISEKIRNNPQITDVISIGVGGSDLGPRLMYNALETARSGPTVHFIKNIDGQSLDTLLAKLNPKHTALLIASKTFTTLETMTCANYAKAWLSNGVNDADLSDHLFATSSAVETAEDFGIPRDHILPMRDWIGGRFSVWSSIGLPLAIAFGFDMFRDFINGAARADHHFIETPLEHNIPVLMALLGIWYRNFFDYAGHAILPYSDALSLLPGYMQQLDMESNGKYAGDTKTAPIVFGDAGTCAQHAFMQALHQSSEIVPCDFIIVARNPHAADHFQQALNANALAQSQALMEGRTNTGEPHRNFEGNRPSSTFVVPTLNAYYLGMLLAFYEHKIFIQGAIWGINSFDQWGVELGKTLAKDIIKDLETGTPSEKHDSSTSGLIRAIVNPS